MGETRTNLLTAIIPVTSNEARILNVARIAESSCEKGISVIIILDSPAEMPDRLLHLMTMNPRNIRVIHGEWNNPGDCRNAGLNLLSTKWVTFWDSDDFPQIDNVIGMIRTADFVGADVCVGGFEKINLLTGQKQEFKTTEDNWQQSTYIYPGLWRFGFNASRISGVRFSTYSMGEDQEFLAKAISCTGKISVESKIVYSYQVGNSDQLTLNFRNYAELLYIFDSMKVIAKSSNKDINKLLGVLKAKIAISALKRGTILVKFRILGRILTSLFPSLIFDSSKLGLGMLRYAFNRIRWQLNA